MNNKSIQSYLSKQQARMNVSMWSSNVRNGDKMSISLRYFCKLYISSELPTSAMRQSFYPSTVSLCSSTHPSIIPSINHETDGLSGVRTDGFPLPRPYHNPLSTDTPRTPHNTHTHTPPASYTSTYTTWPGLTIYHPPPSTLLLIRRCFISFINTHTWKKNMHEMVAKWASSKSVCLWGSVHKEKPPKRAVCLWSLGPVKRDNWWCFHYKVWGNVGVGAQYECVHVYVCVLWG